MVVKWTCPDRSCIKQLRIYHARYQPSLGFSGATNVGHEPSQSGFTLDGFGSHDLQVFAAAQPSIELHTQVLNALFPLNLMFPENDLRLFEGSPVRDQQSIGLFRGHFQASAIQPTLCPPQTFIDPQLKDSDVVSGAHDKCVIREADDARCYMNSVISDRMLSLLTFLIFFIHFFYMKTAGKRVSSIKK